MKTFAPGTPVELTEEGIDTLVIKAKRLKPGQTTGIVVGPSPNLSHCIMVQFDGELVARSFDADYWRKVQPVEPALRDQLTNFMLWARRRKVGPRKRVTDLTPAQAKDLVVDYLTETKPKALMVPTWRPRLGDEVRVYLNPVTGIGGGWKGAGIVMAVTTGGGVRVRFEGEDLMFRWGANGQFSRNIDQWRWYHIERA